MVFLHIDRNNADKHVMNELQTFINNKSAFLLIYMEGCGPCNAVRPEWKKLENVLTEYSKNNDVAIIDIDKDLIENIKNITQPAGFPTIRYITNGGKTVENYEDSDVKNKDRSIDSFVEWINGKQINKSTTKTRHNKTHHNKKGGKSKKIRGGKWSLKYKRSINCRKPKGFSQKQHCRYGRKK
jgi:vacuolar-type H+-ATPase subunit F/Vma7